MLKIKEEIFYLRANSNLQVSNIFWLTINYDVTSPCIAYYYCYFIYLFF